MIRILANTVGLQATKLLVTDSSNVEKTDEIDKLRNIIGGSRHLFYEQTGSVTRRLVYLDEGYGFDFDYMYIRHASLNTGNTINIIEWSDYPGTSNTLASSLDLDAHLVGRDQLDAIYAVADSGGIEAIGIELGNGYQAKVGQVFFCKAVSFDAIQLGASYTRTSIDERQSQYKHYDNFYDLRATYEIKLEVTQQQYHDFLQLPLLHPFVVYDDEQAVLGESAIHCILISHTANVLADDTFYLNLSLGELRQWA